MALQLHVPEIASVIQLAVAPVFMLTAVGTLLNALNARLGRAVDRRRHLEHHLASLPQAEAGEARNELAQIGLRIRYAYLAILFSVLSSVFVCLLIAGAFIGAFVALDFSRVIGAMFVFAVVALLVALLLFLREIFLAVQTPRYVPR
jgi:NADH:ubiquinone oxidoreductase subunit 3 (subunit A)